MSHTTKPRYERRSTTGLQIREANGVKTLFGYAAVFEARSTDLGGFVEIVRRGAFTRALQESDVRALWNHDSRSVLGRTSSQTLRLKEDERGLYYEVDLPDTSIARDVIVMVERGDVTGSSFGFAVRGQDGEKWNNLNGEVVRELRDVELFDVSPVAYPAYEETSIATRSFEAWRQGTNVSRAKRLLDWQRLLEAETLS